MAGKRKTNRYKITLAGGGAAFLIHLPTGNHSSYLGERFRGTVPRGLFQAPEKSLEFDFGQFRPEENTLRTRYPASSQTF